MIQMLMNSGRKYSMLPLNDRLRSWTMAWGVWLVLSTWPYDNTNGCGRVNRAANREHDRKKKYDGGPLHPSLRHWWQVVELLIFHVTSISEVRSYCCFCSLTTAITVTSEVAHSPLARDCTWRSCIINMNTVIVEVLLIFFNQDIMMMSSSTEKRRTCVHQCVTTHPLWKLSLPLI